MLQHGYPTSPWLQLYTYFTHTNPSPFHILSQYYHLKLTTNLGRILQNNKILIIKNYEANIITILSLEIDHESLVGSCKITKF